MTTTRSVVEGIQKQGIDESIVYTLTTTPWYATPVSPTLRLWERVSGSWVERTSALTTMTTATALADVITLPPIRGGDELRTTRAVVAFTAGANVLSCYFDIQWEK